MKRIDANFLQEMKKKLDVELLGVVSMESSNVQELKKQAAALLPRVQSVVVFGKEVFKEVIALLKPSQGVGEAEQGDLLKPHSDYLNGRLTRAAYDLTAL